MTLQIALLRGVNVGGRRMVSMADLRAFLEALGLRDVRTLLQSGNALFESPKATGAKLERLLEEEAAKRLRLETAFFTRTAAEWDEAIAANPFPEEAERDPARLLMMALRSTPAAGAEKALRAAITGRERVRCAGRHAYLVYPDGAGTSRLTIDVIEKHLGSRGTARNWNTVRKLAAAAASG